MLGKRIMETLDQEKFNTAKELVEMQTNLSLGRAELNKLNEETEEYMIIREEKAEQRVLKVFKESREALEATTNNHKELSKYKDELQAYANKLKCFSNEISSLFKDFKQKMNKADNDMEIHYKKVHEVLNQAKSERQIIQTDRKLLDGERALMVNETRLLIDRQQTLERGFKELNKKKLLIN